MVFLWHCLLNENTRYLGRAGRPGCVREIVDGCAGAGLGMVQLPCPEERAWGGVRKRRLLLLYGSARWLPGPLRRVLLPALLAYTRHVYAGIARVTRARVGRRPLALVAGGATNSGSIMGKDHGAHAVVARDRPARMPPRWFVVFFWHAHRLLLRLTRGRLGLWRPRAGRWGALRLTTTGRRTGQQRQVVIGYFEDDGNLVTMAMNGWGAAEPGWWLNLQENPDAVAQTRDGARQVHARRAQGRERERLWARWAEIDKDLDSYAARRPRETAVVVLEPQESTSRT